MINVYSVPRINALGLKGPEKSSKEILRGKEFEEIKISNEDISDDENKIFVEANKFIKKGRCLFVGGDHSITYPIAKAFMLQNGVDDSLLIVFDAHPDCMPSMPEPTHEEIIYGLVKAAKWNKKNIILVGLRKIEKEEEEFLKSEGIRYYNFRDKKNDVLMDILELAKNKKVYVSIDIDVLHTNVAPGVNYKERGGMSKKLLFYYLENIKKNLDVSVWDLVEVVLEKDKKNKTLEVAREIVNFILE